MILALQFILGAIPGSGPSDWEWDAPSFPRSTFENVCLWAFILFVLWKLWTWIRPRK